MTLIRSDRTQGPIMIELRINLITKDPGSTRLHAVRFSARVPAPGFSD